MTISRDNQLALALQQLEKEEVQNLEKKEQMIMRDDELATIMQHQEEGEAQKPMEKEQRSITSKPAGKALLLVQRVLSLHLILQYPIPQNLGVASKVTTLGMNSMFYLAGCLLHLQSVFRVSKKNATVDVG